MTPRRTPLAVRLADLEAHYGTPEEPPPRGPYEMILWENAAYLAADEHRAQAFTALRVRVGLAPDRLLAARLDTLTRVMQLGGIHPELRAKRLKTIAALVRDEFEGDLARVLQLDLIKARRALGRFPTISVPGAEKILLFTRTHPVLALDSNGLRTLLRLGYGAEQKSYRATYRAVQAAAMAELKPDCNVLVRAHLLLRTHGRTLCRATRPACGECPLRLGCAHAIAAAARAAGGPAPAP